MRDEVYAMIAAFLQGKGLPEPDTKIAEYRAALMDAYEYFDEIHGDDPSNIDYRRQRESFYKRHPELRPSATEEQK